MRGLYADHGYHYTRPTFKLLVIAHANSSNPEDDFQRLVWLFTAALSVSSPRMRRRLYFTTASHMRATLQQKSYEEIPATAPTWWRLHDTKQWLGDYEEFVAELPKGTGRKPYTHLRRFVAIRLQKLPQHSLIPGTVIVCPCRQEALQHCNVRCRWRCVSRP